jgi:FkbM family methyltransferase
LIPELKKYRKKDTILNVGVGLSNIREADFYVYAAKGLNTFSKEEVEFRARVGTHKVEKVIKVPLKTINEIINENFPTPPNLLSLDVEGLDLEILKSLDFKSYAPDIICTETITYDEGRGAKKIPEIIDFVCSQGYVVYADTHINTIFVAEKFYPHLKEKNPSYAPSTPKHM